MDVSGEQYQREIIEKLLEQVQIIDNHAINYETFMNTVIDLSVGIIGGELGTYAAANPLHTVTQAIAAGITGDISARLYAEVGFGSPANDDLAVATDNSEIVDAIARVGTTDRPGDVLDLPGIGAPYVVYVTPAKSINAPVDTAPVIRFSKSMQRALLIADGAIILKTGSTTVPTTISVDETNRFVTLTPVDDLDTSTTYFVVVADTVLDYDGTPMDAAYDQNGAGNAWITAS